MSHRPLVLVSGLTFGDYLLWHWSLNGNHEVIALISGLTLVPLAVTLIWLLVVSVGRVLMGRQRTPRSHAAARPEQAAAPPPAGVAPEDVPLPAGAQRSSRRIAA